MSSANSKAFERLRRKATGPKRFKGAWQPVTVYKMLVAKRTKGRDAKLQGLNAERRMAASYHLTDLVMHTMD